MSDFSELPLSQETHGESGLNSSRKISLTFDELVVVRRRWSEEERKEMGDLSSKIFGESTILYGVPATAIGLGSLHLARTHLPAKFHCRSMNYYVMGFGFFTTATLFGYYERRDEHMVPIYARLLKKYIDTKPVANYTAHNHRSRGDADWKGLVPENKSMHATTENVNATVSVKLSQEQIQYLFNRMSSNEREQIQSAIAGCWKKSMEKGAALLAVLLVITGTIFYRIVILKIPHKPWNLRVVRCNNIIGTIVIYISLFEAGGFCQARIQPTMLAPLWKKYGGDELSKGQQPAAKPLLTGTGAEASPVEKENKTVSAERQGKMHANMYGMYAPRGAPQDPFDNPYAVMSGTPRTRERQERRGVQKNPVADESGS